MRLALREALLGFRRAPMLSALGVTTIAFSLFAFGLFALVTVNIRHTLEAMESRVEIRAFLVDGAAAEAVADFMEELGRTREVARVEYVSPEQALARARRDLGEFQDVFEAGFLPASLDIRLREGARDPATVRRLAQQARTHALVDDVRFGEEWVEKLYHIRNVATATGVVLGLAFALVSIIVIGATIRMAVLARHREIAIMRLVGATDGFISRPFLIEGGIKGLLGGALAFWLTWVAHRLISSYVLRTEFFDARLIGVGLVAGAAIGIAGSAISVGRQIRQVL